MKDDEEGIYNAWSPKLSLEYLVGNDTTVYASYGHSFTPAILYQVYRSERSPIKIVNGVPTASTRGSLPNPDLDPEQTDTYELGLKKNGKTPLRILLSTKRIRKMLSVISPRAKHLFTTGYSIKKAIPSTGTSARQRRKASNSVPTINSPIR